MSDSASFTQSKLSIPQSRAATAQKGCPMPYSIPSITITKGLSPYDPKLLDTHASLTTLDSEDWTIISDKSRVYVFAARQQTLHGDDVLVFYRAGWASRGDFLRMLRNLPEDHDLGVVSVRITTDAEASGTPSLLSKLAEIADLKGFNLLKIVLPDADTRQCIRRYTPTPEQ
jgi:hypothetical protein